LTGAGLRAALIFSIVFSPFASNAWAQDPAAAGSATPAASLPKDTAAQASVASTRCGSFVIRHCGAGPRRAPMVIDPDLRRLNRVLYQWAQARFVDPDSDEIVVTSERLPTPTPAEVIEQAIGAQMPSNALVSRDAGNGIRCTTMVRTNRTICSGPGNLLPGEWNPMSDWSF
jgi:hypothetical protein